MNRAGAPQRSAFFILPPASPLYKQNPKPHIRPKVKGETTVKTFFLTLLISILALGCQSTETKATEGKNPMIKEAQKQKVATFAGGCFWCTESDLEKVPGVLKVISGYSGGKQENPTYEEVSSGRTGHLEAIQVYYDPSKVTYEQLLDVFWSNHNPTTLNRQGPDVGDQYRSVIFYHTPEQRAAAEESKAGLDKSGRFNRPIVTQIEPAPTFFPAEDYHQRYLEKRGLSHCTV
jgi:peptide-methionine (S)-S-oxide reductase